MFCNIPPTALNNCLGSFAAVISTDSILYISPAASLSTFGKKTCELGHEYFLKIWQVRRMGVCKAPGKTHFLKIFLGFCWSFSGMLLNIFRTANNGNVCGAREKWADAFFEDYTRPQMINRLLIQNSMSNSKPCFALFFDWKRGWIPLEGKERKSFRTKLHWILNKCVSSGTSVQGGGSLTWIGRGWYRVGATKGYEGEGLEGRVEWLLGGGSTECRDNKLSSAGFNHLPPLIKPDHITLPP